MKKVVLLLVSLLSFLVSVESFAEETVEKTGENKIWRIMFNTPLEEDTIHEGSVYILDENRVELDNLRIEYIEDSTMIKVTNLGSYEPGETYQLVIDEGISSRAGHPLRSKVTKDFKVVDGALQVVQTDPEEKDTVDQLRNELAEKDKEIADLREQVEQLKEAKPEDETEFIDVETEYLNFKMTPNVYENFPHIYESGEQTLTYLEEFFGEPLPTNQTVILHAGESDIEYDDVAVYKGGQNKLIVNVKHFYDRGERDARYHLAHELVHGFEYTLWDMEAIRRNLGSNKEWLVEGLAEYIPKHKVEFSSCTGCGEMKEQFYGKERFADRLKNDHRSSYPPYDYTKINRLSDTLDTTTPMGGYLVYESVIFYMIEAHSMESFEKFIDEIESGTYLDEALLSSFEKNEKEFIAGWKDYFNL